MSTTYVAIDLETTGLDPTRESIIEMAAITFQDGQILDEWSSLVDPNRAIPQNITKLTGITSEMVLDAPSINSLRTKIKSIVDDQVIIGHNVDFDLGFLNAERLALRNHRVDTLTLASILIPEGGRFGLAALSAFLGLPSAELGQDHRALDDARRTLDLFLVLQQKARDLPANILNEIVQSGRNLGWPETIFFEDAVRTTDRPAAGGANRLAKLFQPAKLEGRQLVASDKPVQVDIEMISAMLQPGGNFSRLFPGFEYRPQQIEMLEAVGEAFNEGNHLIVEAGTGTGKSIGYLLPAAFWAYENERRVVVSTNTINLQDQLLHKDLPDLEEILPFEVRGAILKGKRNYLCTRLFQQMRHSGPGSADEMALYARVLVWLPGSANGDLSEINLRTPGERLAWERLSAENDACTAEKCAVEGCPLHWARRRAEQAHILVVNHALLLADVASDNRVLPEYVDLIVDEAHHLEGAVTSGLSFRTDKRYIESLLDEINKPRAGLVADMQRRVSAALPRELSSLFTGRVTRLRETGQNAVQGLDEFFSSLNYVMDQFINKNSQYSERIRLTSALRVQPDFDQLIMSWDNLDSQLQVIGEELGKLAGAVADASESFDIEDGEDLRIALVSLARNLDEVRTNVDGMLTNPSDSMIYWVEVFRKRTSFNAAPLHIGPLVEEHIFNAKETVVLTSATLQTAEPGQRDESSFAYLRDRLHAFDAEDLAVGSPFDYESSTLVYLPTDMPEPNQPGYQRYVEEAILDVAKVLGGRTMALFTSYSQLRATADALNRPLAAAGISSLAQSDGVSRKHLLDQFQSEDARSVLFGTRSFWEGVDVPGEALQAVIIVKLPFDVPSDPVFAARSETFDSPFFEYSIPEAVLRFRQGFGRLIRRQNDHGVVVILDKRVLSKRYGQAFLKALPKCTVLRQRIDRLGELSLRWIDRNYS